MKRAPLLAASLLAAALAGEAAAQTLTLSPAVVPLRGAPGESAIHELTLRNGTAQDLDFVLEALDVVVRDGARVVLGADEMAGSIGASAVFSPARLAVPAGASRSVRLTLTVPPAPAHRAVVALFRSVTALEVGEERAFLSLGALFTFQLSDSLSLDAPELRATPPSDTANALFESALFNDGAEPVELRGSAVILDGRGAIVGKAAFPVRRLLPGERTTVSTEWAGELASGTYRALATFDFGAAPVVRSTKLVVR